MDLDFLKLLTTIYDDYADYSRSYINLEYFKLNKTKFDPKFCRTFFILKIYLQCVIMDTENIETITGSQDITFKESHPIETTIDYITTPISELSLANRLAMPDAATITEAQNVRAVQSSINQNLETEVQLDTFTWSTSQGTGVNLTATKSFPQYYFAQMSETFVTRMLSNYAYMRWDAIEISVKLNSTKFHQGAVRVFSTPMRCRAEDPGANFCIQTNNCPQLPGGWLYANQSNSIVFRIPWQQTHPYIPIFSSGFDAAQHTVAMLHFRVVVPLSSGSGNEDNVNLLLFAKFINPSVAVRDLAGALPTGTYQYEELQTVLPERRVRAQASSALSGAITGGLETAMAIESGNVLGAITSGVKTVNSISTLVQNLDKPMYHETSRVAMRTTSSISHGSGVSFAHKLGITPSDTHVVPKELQSDSRELDLLYIAQQYGIAGILVWTQAQPKGTILSQINCNYLFARITTPSGQDCTYSPLPLTYVASRFKLAKGGIKFRITIVSSSIHSGRLDLSFYPHVSAMASGIKNATSLKNYVIDFNEQNYQFEWTVPYYLSEAWWTMNTSLDKIHTYPGIEHTSAWGWGSMVIMVASELVTTTQVTNSVSVIVEVAGATDFEVAMPTRGYPYESAALEFKEKLVRAQTRDSYLTEATASKSGLSEVVALKNIFHGDDVETSVNVLCRRYGALSLRRWNVRDFTQISWINTPMLDYFWDEAGTGVVTTRAPQINLAWFGSIYAFWSGPLRYHIITSCSRNQKMIATFRLDPTNEDYGPTDPGITPHEVLASSKPAFDRFNMPTDIINGASQPYFEEEVPFVSNTWMKVNIDAPSMPGYNTTNSGQLQWAGWMTFNTLNEVDGPDQDPPITEKLSFYLLQSAGDSFTFHAFIGIPNFVLPEGTLSQP